MFKKTLASAACLLVMGCTTGGVEDGRFSTGSSTVAASADYSIVYSVDTEGGTLAAYDVDDDSVRNVEVGAQPTRVARAGDDLLVTLRGQREIAVVDDRGGEMQVVDRIPTGAEPYGVIASEDGSRVYYSSSISGTVHELDGATHEELRTWRVQDQPRWLALHPTGESLYVGSAFGGTLSWIDLDTDDVVPMVLPELGGNDLVSGDPITLIPRVTGDITVAPNGKTLLVPTLYVDNESGASAGNGGITVQYYAGAGNGSTRFNPVAVIVPLTDGGAPVTSEAEAVDLATQISSREVVNSYVTSMTVSPDGETVYATMETASTVVAFSLTRTGGASTGIGPSAAAQSRTSAVDRGMRPVSGGSTASLRSILPIEVDAGPTGIVFTTDGRAWVHNFLDRTLARIDASGAHDVLSPSTEVTYNIDERPRAGSPVVVAESALTPDEEAGRALFFSSTDTRMAASGAGVSCSTCHFEGRNDGLSWPLEDGDRNTPSLAGEVSLTEPVTWTDAVATVADEAMITSSSRMGGSALGRSAAQRIASFIDSTPEVDSVLKGSLDPAVARGEAIFNREDVGCADCHSGVAYTDNAPYAMFGEPMVLTRSLVGISASAPYLHDGSVATLRQLLEAVQEGEMGDTGMLSGGELDDLEAYLKSL